MPFNQFGTWQIAGDLLPSRTPQQKKEQTLATAFLRVGKRTTENGAIDEEYRVEYAVDRTNTIGTAFLGLTVGCARCHDHKYDPISHKDFYSLSGLLQQHRRAGLLRAGPHRHHRRADAAVDRRRRPTRRSRRPKRASRSRRRPTPRPSPPRARDAAAEGRQRWPARRPTPPPRSGSRCRRRSSRTTRSRRPSPSPTTSCRGRSRATGARRRRRWRRKRVAFAGFGGPPPGQPPTPAPPAAARSAPRRRRPERSAHDGAERGNLTGEELQQVVRRVRTLPADLVRDSLRFSPSGTLERPPALARSADPQGRRQGQGVLLRRQQPRRARRRRRRLRAHAAVQHRPLGAAEPGLRGRRPSSTTARTTTPATPATSCSSTRTACSSTCSTRAPAT